MRATGSRGERRRRTVERRAFVGTGVLLAAVFVLKGTLAISLAGHPLLQPVGELDSGEYWRLAQRVASGDVLLAGTSFYVSPLYIYALAVLQLVTGASLSGVLVLQAALGTLAVWIAGRTASRWGNARAAVIAAGLVTLTGIVALQEATILQSALDPLLTACFLLAFTLALHRGGPRAWLLVGVSLALFALNRPNAWVLGALCAAAALARETLRARALVALAIGTVLVLAPFSLRTSIATGQWQVLPGHGGLNVYIGNHPNATGTYTVLEDIRPSIAGQREDTRRVAEAAVGRRLTDAEVSGYFAHRAIAWWRVEPLAAVRLTVYKAWLAVHAWELPVNVSYAWFREQVVLLWLLPVGAWMLMPLATAALAAGPSGVRAEHAGAWRWFRLVLPVYLAGVALVFVVDRYRAPGLVMAALAAAPFLATDWRRWPRPALVAGALTFGIGLVPLPFDLGQGEADTRMALEAISTGRDDEARMWLARAASRHVEPGVAFFRAGLAWHAQARWSDAEQALREALRLDPDVPEVGFALAGVLLSQGKGAEAVPLLREADRAGVRPDRTRLDLALALWQAGEEAAARGVLAEDVPAAGFPLLRARALAAVEAREVPLATWLLTVHRDSVRTDSEVAEKLGLMLATQGKLDQAAVEIEDACRLDPRRATARFNLAIVRLQQGRRADALALLREALRIDPGYAQAAGALRELGET